MFQLPVSVSSYSVTPSSHQTPFSRLPSRASTIIRDVKRRSLRHCRVNTELVERRLSGTFLQIGEEVEEAPGTDLGGCTHCRRERKGRQEHLPSTPHLPHLPTWDDKENLIPEVSHKEVITRTQSLRRRCSSYFTPKNKRSASNAREEDGGGGTSITYSLARRSSLGSSLETPVRDVSRCQLSGAGRLIPVKQGHMYKRVGVSRMYRRKYVTLCTDSVLTYWPSFQAYVDNVDGKDIQLSHVTVKVAGKPPTGVRTAGKEEEDVTTLPQLTIEEIEEEGERMDLVLVSLDSSTWHFQLVSPREAREWVEAIQEEILASLTRREVTSDLETIRGLPGNTECADCSARDPDWASVNLGVLVCIECSGVHRNLGTHVTKVRSLHLDIWSEIHVRILELLGNTLVNSVLEENIESSTSGKPRPGSARREKEKFIQEKYVRKAFICPVLGEDTLENAVKRAVTNMDMEKLVKVVVHTGNELGNKLRKEEGLLGELLGSHEEKRKKRVINVE